MNLAPDSLKFGVKPEFLIDCARQLVLLDSFTREDFCEALTAPELEAIPVLQAMIGEGYIQTSPDGPKLLPTELLRRLAVASVSHGLPRADAERLLERVVRKAREINADPTVHCGRIVRIAVFGSYLSDKPVLGDLDLAIEVLELLALKERRRRILKEIRLAGPTQRIMSALRLRKPQLISTHTYKELLSLETPFRVVFEETK